MSKGWQHFKTITHHKVLVCKNCFKVGLIWQGLTHDLSKYSPTEFKVGAKYFQGTRSPNNAEREDIGYSSAWLHHKGRNKHHFEYWLDYGKKEDGKIGIIPAPMPKKYIAEMIMDRIAASMVYLGDKYTDSSALEYYKFEKSIGNEFIHKDTEEVLVMLLTMLSEKGEKETFKYIKKYLKEK
ncbi:MAG: catalase [Lachnospiraceae bacterium]|nr:catalase [Lachnospiraceae bacterium]MBR4993456.1 catalase [Lachnospiraceae bacterium]MBR5944260.1 catalase [Lachnospiraceae bacterium]